MQSRCLIEKCCDAWKYSLDIAGVLLAVGIVEHLCISDSLSQGVLVAADIKKSILTVTAVKGTVCISIYLISPPGWLPAVAAKIFKGAVFKDDMGIIKTIST